MKKISLQSLDDIKEVRFLDSSFVLGERDYTFSCKISNENHELTYFKTLTDDGWGYSLYIDNEPLEFLCDFDYKITDIEKFIDSLEIRIVFVSYSNKIEDASDMDELENIKFELMEDSNPYLNKVISKLWVQYNEKEQGLFVEYQEESARGLGL